jgi:D-lyxose ketol-isomerase
MRFSKELRRFCKIDGDSESLNVVVNDEERFCSFLLIIDTPT